MAQQQFQTGPHKITLGLFQQSFDQSVSPDNVAVEFVDQFSIVPLSRLHTVFGNLHRTANSPQHIALDVRLNNNRPLHWMVLYNA
jgi:hypothetical protein